MRDLIDRDELDRQTFGDPELRAEIIAMFREQAPLIIQAIDAAAGAGRADAAHRLKGTALSLGAQPLAAAAAALEAAPSDAQALLRVRHVLQETLSALADCHG